MASIQKRTDSDGNTTYRVQVRLKGFPSQTATFPRLTDARKWAQDTESAIREGRYFKTTEARRHALDDAIQRYREQFPESTGKDTHLDWWSKRIGKYVMADINRPLLSQCRDELRTSKTKGRMQKVDRERSTSTVNRYMASLSAVLTVAWREWEWIAENPIRKMKALKEPKGVERFLSQEEIARLIPVIKESQSPFLYLAVTLAVSTGARRSEIMGLTWKQVNVKTGQISLTETKNGESRTIMVGEPALSLLKQRSKIKHLHTALVFPNEEGTAPVDLTKAWKTALEVAQIKDFRWHDLRHTAASYLAMSGASAPEIATILGHKTLQMSKRYIHLNQSHLSSVVEKMNQQLFEAVDLPKTTNDTEKA